MKLPFKIFFKCFVKPFYKENIGAFIFAFTMLFFIVNNVDGAGLYEYHYSLVTGMLHSTVLTIIVFFAWLLYARKCAKFISFTIARTECSFLHIYNQLPANKRFKLFLLAEISVMLPILLYSLFIFFVGIQQGLYMQVMIIALYLGLLCIVAAYGSKQLLQNPEKKPAFSFISNTKNLLRYSSYTFILLRFFAGKQKMIWIGIQAYTCGISYLIARNNNAAEYDSGLVFLFFTFGILGNCILVFRLREFEEDYMRFFRSLPVTVVKRFRTYIFIYLLYLLPVILTIAALTPVHLHYDDAISFILISYATILLMHCITYVQDFSMREFVIIMISVFCLQCLFLVSVGLVVLSMLFFIAATLIFFKSYYLFEKEII